MSESENAEPVVAPDTQRKASPYMRLPDRQFWSKAVQPADFKSVENIYSKRFSIEGLDVATAGSCFAQHVAKNLKLNGYTVLDMEPGMPYITAAVAKRFGYDTYSARYGNIYTARRLRQLAEEAAGLLKPDADDLVWSRANRYWDALRPSVEPKGLASPEEVLMQRADHVSRVRRLLERTKLFVFTFGLTEAWMSRRSGLVYAQAPGTPIEGRLVGSYDESAHAFVNFRVQDVYDDFVAFRKIAHSFNSEMKFLVTVSPVPLAVSAVDAHVLAATVRSKAVLRAAAAQLYEDFADIDYFPSFELLSTPFLGAARFEEDKREVQPRAVAMVMRHFFSEHPPLNGKRLRTASEEDVVCEEALLKAFSK